MDAAAGGTCSLASLLESGPTLVAFYKVTCPTCQLTLPFLQRLEGSKVQVVTIAQDEAEDIREFDEVFGTHLPALIDHEDAGYPASNAYGITHVPSMFLVEPSGVVSWTSVGFLKRELEELASRAGVEIFKPSDRVPDWKGG